jgi:xanthine dehydrogenase accessory factor
MDNLWDRAESLLAEGKSFVLATIIRTRGSVPREVGAKMVVPREGQPFGTIGGGCGEGEVLRRAYPLFDQNVPPRVVQVDLTGDFDQDVIQVCGGVMDVALDLWKPDEHRELVHALAEATHARRPAALVTAINPVETLPAGAKSCLSLDQNGTVLTPALPLDPATVRTFATSVSAGTPQLFSLSPQGELVEDSVARGQEWPRIFVDVQPGVQTLIIVGAGHIAQPLYEIGHMLGFRTVVIDDRWAFANRERFPHATDVRVGAFEETLNSLDINEHSYVVVVTRGHVWDEASVKAVLRRNPAYIGMIGSKRRAKTTLERLKEEGYRPEELSRIHTPLGLDIAAETPAEIAVAIAAELIRVRRGGSLETLSLAAKARPSGPFKFTGN